MNPLLALQQSATMYFVVPGGMVFRLKRIRSADLVAIGHAELVGQSEVREVLRGVQDAMKASQAPDGDLSDEDLKKRRAIETFDTQAALLKFNETMLKSPERQQAWSDRTDAWCCAGITGLAWLKDGHVTSEDEETNGQIRVDQYSEVTIDQIDEVTDVLFVRRESEADAENGSAWIGNVHATHRQIIHGAIAGMNGVAAAAHSFRQKPGSTAGGVPSGE